MKGMDKIWKDSMDGRKIVEMGSGKGEDDRWEGRRKGMERRRRKRREKRREECGGRERRGGKVEREGDEEGRRKK